MSSWMTVPTVLGLTSIQLEHGRHGLATGSSCPSSRALKSPFHGAPRAGHRGNCRCAQRGLVFSAPGRSMSAILTSMAVLSDCLSSAVGPRRVLGGARGQCRNGGRGISCLWHLLQTSASARLILRAFLQGPTKQHDEIICFIFLQESAGSKLLHGL